MSESYNTLKKYYHTDEKLVTENSLHNKEKASILTIVLLGAGIVTTVIGLTKIIFHAENPPPIPKK